MSQKVDNLSQEFFYGINGVNELAAQLQSGMISNDEAEQNRSVTEIKPDDVLMSGLVPHDTQSVSSTDAIIPPRNKPEPAKKRPTGVQNGGHNRIPPPGLVPTTVDRFVQVDVVPEKRVGNVVSVEKISNDEEVDDVDEDEESVKRVEDYIGDLENKFVKNGKSTPPPIDDVNDDAASEESGISNISNLKDKKRVPPFPAKNFDLGHVQSYNGRHFRTIKTANGIIRWGRAE